MSSCQLPDGVGTHGVIITDRKPQKLSELMFLIEVINYYICLNWLSGALVGVGGSDFIGYITAAPRFPARSMSMAISDEIYGIRGRMHGIRGAFVKGPACRTDTLNKQQQAN